MAGSVVHIRPLIVDRDFKAYVRSIPGLSFTLFFDLFFTETFVVPGTSSLFPAMNKVVVDLKKSYGFLSYFEVAESASDFASDTAPADVALRAYLIASRHAAERELLRDFALKVFIYIISVPRSGGGNVVTGSFGTGS